MPGESNRVRPISGRIASPSLRRVYSRFVVGLLGAVTVTAVLSAHFALIDFRWYMPRLWPSSPPMSGYPDTIVELWGTALTGLYPHDTFAFTVSYLRSPYVFGPFVVASLVALVVALMRRKGASSGRGK